MAAHQCGKQVLPNAAPTARLGPRPRHHGCELAHPTTCPTPPAYSLPSAGGAQGARGASKRIFFYAEPDLTSGEVGDSVAARAHGRDGCGWIAGSSEEGRHLPRAAGWCSTLCSAHPGAHVCTGMLDAEESYLLQLPPEVRLRCHAAVPSADSLARPPSDVEQEGAVNRRWSWCWRRWTAGPSASWALHACSCQKPSLTASCGR
jgi:hypothetical protein